MFQAPETDTAPGGFKAPEDDAEPPKSLEGFLHNAGSNAMRLINPKNIIQGMGDTIKTGAYDIPKATMEGLSDFSKDAAETAVTGELPPEDAERNPMLKEVDKLSEPFAKDPVGYMYKNPVDTALLASSVVAPFMGEGSAAVPRGTIAKAGVELPKGAPGIAEALEAAPKEPLPLPKGVLDDLVKMGEPSGTPPPAPASRIPPDPNAPPPVEPVKPPPAAGEVPPPPPPKASMFENMAQEGLDQAKDVKDYISRGYEGFAKKPGAIADVADWVQEKSQMMAAQQIGVTPNQMRQMGRTPLEAQNAMRAIGQYALDHDIVSPTTGLTGMLEKNVALMKETGKKLGEFRKEADSVLGKEIDPADIVKEVRAELDQKYMRGVTPENPTPRGAHGGNAGAYLRALQEIEDAPHSLSGMAQASTELNKAANKAGKNLQPEVPFTDVANALSRINNERINALLGGEKAAKYEQALREFGVNKKIQNALKFKSSGEVKRFGPGSFTSNAVQKVMDEAGYRFGAKAANKLSTSILKSPGVAKSLPSLFKEFINQIDDVGQEVAGMSKGGIVSDDVRKYVGC